MIKVYVLVAESCSDCDARDVRVFNRPITEEDENALIKELGGMHCITVHRYEGEIEGVYQ